MFSLPPLPSFAIPPTPLYPPFSLPSFSPLFPPLSVPIFQESPLQRVVGRMVRVADSFSSYPLTKPQSISEISKLGDSAVPPSKRTLNSDADRTFNRRSYRITSRSAAIQRGSSLSIYRHSFEFESSREKKSPDRVLSRARPLLGAVP